MREIKFKAFDKKYDCIVDVVEISFETNTILIEYIDEHDGDIVQEWRDFKDIELMQFTGIEDKNGVEIHEGDIVKLKYVSYPLEVKYNVALAQFQMGDEHRFTALQDVEVIGNIYENKELLQC